MIDIKVSNGISYVWNPQDWLCLRRDHRILGYFDGAEASGFTNPLHWRLPFKLSKIETQYLISQGICRTVHAPTLKDESPCISQQTHADFMECRKQRHLDIFKKRRLTEIEYYIDDMLEGKRKKGKLGSLDKESFIMNELAKVSRTAYDAIELDLKDPWLNEKDYISYDFPIPQTYLERLRLKVFEDFHLHKKYYLSPGHKFGGDYLAYPGDPAHHHAEFIIVCPDKELDFYDLQRNIISHSRLANTVKKKLIIASLEETTDSLKYFLCDQFNTKS